jgi:predicted nucleotidyltransferase
MPAKEEVLKKLQHSLPDLKRRYGLKRIGIFGSVARGAQKPGSDVDVVAEFERPVGLRFVEFNEELERILGTKADVLTPAGVSGIRNAGIAESIRESIVYVQPV